MTATRLSLLAVLACAVSSAQILYPPEAADAFAPYTFVRFGGSAQDSAQAIASDRTGSIYVAGTTRSTNLPATNAAQPESEEAPAMRSSDGGRTWQKIASPPTTSEVSFLIAHPAIPGLVFAGAADILYRSVDAGQSWRAVFTASPREVNGSGSVVTVGFDPASPARVHLFSSTGFSTSDDAGQTWQTMTRSSFFFFPGFIPAGIQVDPKDSGTMLLNPGALLSRDGGRSWTPLRPPAPSTSAIASFDPHRAGRIYLGVSAGAAGSLFVSDDLGQTWTATKAQTNSAVTQILVDPDSPGVLYVLTLGRLLTSENGAETWKPRTELPLSLNYRLDRVTGCGVAPHLIATGGWQQLLDSPDRGATWNATPLRDVSAFAGGPACTMYVLKQLSGDAFVARWNRDGQLQWSTYLSTLGQDGATALALDAQGNVIVSGYTESTANPLVAKYAPDGRLLWKKTRGASLQGLVNDLAVDSAGNILLVGAANSDQGRGFALKLSAAGDLLWSTFFEDSARSAAVELDGSLLIVTEVQSQLLRLNAAGSEAEVLQTAVKRPTVVRTGADGSVYLAGSVAPEESPVSPGAYVSPRRAGECGPIAWLGYYRYGGDLQVARLRPRTLDIEFSALLGGECGTAAKSLDISPDQRITVGFTTQAHAFDTVGAIASAGFCRSADLATGVAQLSADGSRLLRSTLLDGCDVIHVATLDSDIYATSADNAPDALVLRVPSDLESGPRIDRIANAFSGTGHGISPGELVVIDGGGLGPSEVMDLGINPEQDLPLELGDTQVLVDGMPAPILRATPTQLVVVAPQSLNSPSVTIRLLHAGQRSNPVLARVIAYDPAILPLSFPLVQPGMMHHANARNADGSLNGPGNPAAPGSLVWVFATGLGTTGPPIPAGAIAASDSLGPISQFRDLNYAPIPGIRSMRGFVGSLFAVPMRIPDVAPESGQQILRLTTATSFRGTNRRSFSAPAFVYVRRPQ